jgi:photosystem II stability/assembly factor-like uncharacterized protein
VRKLALSCAAAAVMLCACRDEHTAAGTGFLVTVSYPQTLKIDQFRFDVRDDKGVLLSTTRPDPGGPQLPSPESIRLKLKDSQAGSELAVRVEALFGGRVVASGERKATAKVGYEVDVDLRIGDDLPIELFFSNSPTVSEAGGCAGPLELHPRNASAQSSPVVTDVSVALTADSSTARFFSDASCKSELTSLALNAGQSVGTFFFLDTKAGSRTLTATADAPEIAPASQKQNVRPGAAARLGFVNLTDPVAAGACGTGAVEIEDQFGNGLKVAAETTVVLSVTPSTTFRVHASADCSGSPVGTAVISPDTTHAAFSFIDATPGSVTLRASVPTLAAAEKTVRVEAGPPAILAFTVQPPTAGVQAGKSFTVSVSVTDKAGNLVTSAAPHILLSLSNTPPGGTLSGMLDVSPQAGVAVFTVSVDKSQPGYSLSATANQLSPVTSDPFDVAAGAPAKLGFRTQPMLAVAGQMLSSTVIEVEDAQGNPIPVGAGTPISLTLSAGATLFGTTTRNTTAGSIASFEDLSVHTAGSGYRLTAHSAALLGTSAPFEVVPEEPQVLQLQPAVGASTAGAPLAGGPFSVQLRDSFGNPCTNFMGTVQLSAESLDGGLSPMLGGTLSANSTDAGAASFGDLHLDKAGTFRLHASAGTSAPGYSNPFPVAAAAASALVFDAPSYSVAQNGPFSLAITAVDAFGNTATAAGAVGLTVSQGALSGLVSKPLVQGVASFSGLRADTQGSLTLTASGSGLNSAAPLLVGAPTSNHLAFTAFAPSGQSGAALPAFQIRVLDANDTLVIGSTATISLSISSGPSGATLTGGTATAAGGQASFNNLRVDKVGVYRFQASASGVLDGLSPELTLSSGAVASLVFSAQPTSSVGAMSGFSVEVTARDAAGNTATGFGSDVSLSLQSPMGATLSGAAMVTASAGLATFAGLKIDKASMQTLVASAAGVSGTSNVFSVVPGVATRLAFRTAPASVQSGADFYLDVDVVDEGGNRVTGTNPMISISRLSGPGTLTGNSAQSAAGGTAAFTLQLDKVGSYQLQAVAAGPSLAGTTAQLLVDSGQATVLFFSKQPPVSITAGVYFPVKVELRDAAGNVVTNGSSGSVTLSRVPASVEADEIAVPVNGVASFNLMISKVNSYVLRATSGALSADGNGLAVNPAAPSKLAFNGKPADTAAGATLNPVIVEVHDAWDNLCTSYLPPPGVTIDVQLGSAPAGAKLVGSPTSLKATGGVASFSGLSVDTVGDYTLNASSVGQGLAQGGSQPFHINLAGGTITLFNGQAAVNAVSITLTVSSSNAAFFCTLESSTAPAANSLCWRAYVTSPVGFALSPGDGVKTVYAYFKSSGGVVSAGTSDSIILDTVKPTAPTILTPIGGGNRKLTVSWTLGTDPNGIRWTEVSTSRTPGGPYTNWQATSAPGTVTTLYGIPNGSPIYVVARTIDTAGNASVYSVEQTAQARFPFEPQLRLPTPNKLRAVHMFSPTAAVALGTAGTVLTTADGWATTTRRDALSDEDLRAFDVDPDGALVAVGFKGAAALSLDQGVNWYFVFPSVSTDLLGIAYVGTSGGNRRYVAVGTSGVILLGTRPVGTTSTSVSFTKLTTSVNPSTPLYGVASDNLVPSTVIAVGTSGTLVRSTDSGATWTVLSPVVNYTNAQFFSVTHVPTTNRFYVGMVATSATDTLLVSNDSGQTWGPVAGSNPFSVYGLSASSSTSLWANGSNWSTSLGENGNHTFKFNGTTMVPQTLPATSLNGGKAIFDLDGSNVVAVGDFGQIDVTTNGGANWADVSKGSRSVANGIAMVPGTNEGWIVGSGGTITHTLDNGNTWSPLTPTTETWLAVAAPTSNAAFAVGMAGKIRGYSSGSWVNHTSGTAATLNAVSCYSAVDCFAVGASRTILQYSGATTWASVGVAGTPNYQSITTYLAGATRRAIAVGTAGDVKYFNGTSWTAATAGAADLYSVSAKVDGSGVALAVGAGGVYKTTTHGATWTQVSSYPPYDLVKNVSGSTWYAVNGNAVYKSLDDGTNWFALTPGVHSIAGGSVANFSGIGVNNTPNDLWLLGADGFVLRSTTGGE